MPLQLQSFTFNEFAENTFILFDETGECLIIDPGCGRVSEQKILADFIEENRLSPVMLVNTHCHIDHVLGNAWVSHKYRLGLFAHELEKPTLQMQPMVANMYGLKYDESPMITGYLSEGQEIGFGNTILKILFVPGHAPGHICLYAKSANLLIAGDTLFDGSIGRTDLPGGHHDTLISRIKSELFTLPPDTLVYPGHGPATSIGKEIKTNPFF